MTPLDQDWSVWIAGNLVRGRPAAELVDALVAEGFPREEAEAHVTTLEESPGVLGARLALRPMMLAHRLRREQLKLGSREVQVRSGLDARALYDEYIAPQRPVVWTDATAGWPARDWTWDELVARLGEVEVNVCEGRASVEEPARRWRPLVRRRPLKEVVARILDPTTGDDLYVTANNGALEGPLHALMADVRPIVGVLPAHRLKFSSVWMGPAGTRTPPHHDGGDILFCQILGRKRVLLAPPEDTVLAERGVGTFGPGRACSSQPAGGTRWRRWSRASR